LAKCQILFSTEVVDYQRPIKKDEELWLYFRKIIGFDELDFGWKLAFQHILLVTDNENIRFL
tara:strand:+ start:247 stop:432 length:186 start_codon:yes stop_codon:yes gene_type:complete